MLTATVVTLTGVVAVLSVLVVGLLRSHAEILRRLHELGAGVYDDDDAAAGPTPIALQAPAARTGARVPEALSGSTPTGSAVSIGLTDRDEATLVAFLSTGCATCAELWDALDRGGASQLRRDGVRTVIVTRGSDQESPAEVARLAPGDVPTLMSTEGWRDFGVAASPYFVLVDGGIVAGEGTAGSWDQVAGLITRAGRDVLA